MNRILGECHNRLLIVDGARSTTTKQFMPGHTDTATADVLRAAGWSDYDGPAEAVNGWVVPGSDPRLHPRSFKR